MDDIIVGISTTVGVGAISIVRMTGKGSIELVNSIFNGRDLNQVKTHTINYGNIIGKNNEIIDEVLVSVMKTPNTYTKEDVVEINCHGGIQTTNKVLEQCLLSGARLAEPGEFTKRAFINGRIDLTQSEGIMNLINSKTELSRKIAINQLKGTSSLKIKELRKYLIEIIAQIEVNIDYPEYEDIEQLENEHLKPKIKIIKEELNKIIKDSENGKLIKEGINAAIVGKPNVGKSSILNMLLDEEKAIVTDVAGTTRDVVEGQLNIEGLIINLLDTAGIRETTDKVEMIGVSKSLELISNNDLIFFVLNNNEELKKEDIELFNKINHKNYIIIINKTDLESRLELIDEFNKERLIYMNTTKKEGMEQLKSKVKEIYNLGEIEVADTTYITNTKSLSLLKKSLDDIEKIELGINNNIPIDLLEIDLKQIWNNLGEITGESFHEELLDQLFSQFCLGK